MYACGGRWLGEVIPIDAEIHQHVFWWWPTACILKPILSAPSAVKNIEILDRAVNKDSSVTGFDCSNLGFAQILGDHPVSEDLSGRGYCGSIGVFELSWRL